MTPGCWRRWARRQSCSRMIFIRGRKIHCSHCRNQQGIDRKRLDAEPASTLGAPHPTTLHHQFTLDQQQVVGNRQNTLLDPSETDPGFCRASAAPAAVTLLLDAAWAMVFHSWPEGRAAVGVKSGRDAPTARPAAHRPGPGAPEPGDTAPAAHAGNALGTLQARSGYR